MKDKKETPEEGQNPLWPGEGLQEPGTITDKDRDEKTIIPEVE